MEIPKYYEMHKPFLEFLKDGQSQTIKDIKKYIANHFNLSEEDTKIMLESGRQTVFSNRVGWARTYLKKAGLIDSATRGIFNITKDGLNTLNENPKVIDNKYLMKFKSFRDFINGSQNIGGSKGNTPDDVFENSFKAINKNLSDELLSEILKISPTSFEKMIMDLLTTMGYGAFENSAKTTPITGDEGIDGIIMQDKLGFDLIFIQAKKWALDRTVGREEIQKFVGAISGKGGKGLFVTTSHYSNQALEYAKKQHIILIDGEQLTKLMIEHNFAVYTKKIFEIKSIDTDTLNEYLDN